jgi:hypothetical protein
MGLRISDFVSLESVIMTVIYLIDTTQQKIFGACRIYGSKSRLHCPHKLRVSMIRSNESSANNYVYVVA